MKIHRAERGKNIPKAFLASNLSVRTISCVLPFHLLLTEKIIGDITVTYIHTYRDTHTPKYIYNSQKPYLSHIGWMREQPERVKYRARKW